MKSRVARRRPAAAPPPRTVRQEPSTFAPQQGLLALQQIAGNQAVQRLIASGTIQRDHHLPQFRQGGGATTVPVPPPTVSRPPNRPPPPVPGGTTSSRPPNRPPPPVPLTGSRPPNRPPPPVPGGRRPPNRPPPLTPPEQRALDALGKSPEVWADEAITEAYTATDAGIKTLNAAAKTRLGSGGITPIADAATTNGMDRLIESLVTDAMGKVVTEIVGKKDRHGKLVKDKPVFGKAQFDEQRFGALLPTIDTALTARGSAPTSPGSKTPAKDEYVKMAARTITDPKKREELLKKAGLAAAQKGAETALKKAGPVLNEANTHKPALQSAASGAVREVFEAQIQTNMASFSRDLESAKLLRKAFDAGRDRRDIISNAERIKIRSEDRASPGALDAIEALGVDAAEAAVNEKVAELAPKAGAALQSHLTKNLTALQTITAAASTETDRLMQDPAFAKRAAEEAINETLSGKLDSGLKHIGKICGKGKRPGDTRKIDLIIRVPVDPTATGFIGFQVRATSKRNDDLSLNMHAELNIIGGAKVPGIDVEAMGQLGGYFDLKVAHDPTGQRKDGQQAGNLLSYALYRRFQESKVIPQAFVDWIWGMGGKSKEGSESTSDAKRREAELWGKAQEEGFAEGDWVETGALAGGRAKAGIQAGGGKVGVKGGIGVLTGTRYDKKTIAEGREKAEKRSGREARMTKLGRGVTTLRADASATVGPLTGGADFSVTFRDQPKESEDTVLSANLTLFLQGMVMKKAMFGDPAEAALRLATWLAELGLLGQKVIDTADERMRGMERVKPGLSEAKLAYKGRRLGMEGFSTASSLFTGQWQAQHELFEQAQALQEGSFTIGEVGSKIGETAQNVGSGVSGGAQGIPGLFGAIGPSVRGLNGGPMQEQLGNI
ncbi:MAG: hypothetical protein ACM3S1_01005, partial [Hyphomicrobiales bacterium]